MIGEITKTLSGEKFKKKLLKGVNKVGDMVGSTMGPYGRNILIERKVHEYPAATNDGKRVAKAIEPRDAIERMAVKAILNAAEVTDLKAGDGTTCTTVLSQAIIHEVFERIPDETFENLGLNPQEEVSVVALRKEINEAKEKIIKELEKDKRVINTLEDLEKVAITSVEDEELGKTIAKMIDKVGKDGHIYVEEGFNFETETEVIEGMKFDGKLAANFMVDDAHRLATELKNAKVIVTNHELKDFGTFNRGNNSSIMGDLSQQGDMTLVIMAWKFEKRFLIETAKLREKGFRIYCIKLPSENTEKLKDISIYCGTPLVDKNQSMKLADVNISDLGEVKRITANFEETVLVGGKGTKKAVDKRIEELKDQLKIEKLPEFRKKMSRRISDLSSAIGIIKVGHNTQIEQFYVVDKAQDAVLATREAMRDGVVRGGS